ncbi:ARM repeat-containing protein [Gonapodya prolifera JEL478]|uniref:ARM repeat-containing protein n=1 Tax=Gonapodya prolifera (strain JEL478) TaxID=1344416 RepID=A0A139A3P3_GONPJ|nr:ARM repeat-containing protein [Gonapodya prolifera JEL478]|eukprot:KXS11401.1 ARM repeat-containing protein [Gonapodya prolifera JEL478]
MDSSSPRSQIASALLDASSPVPDARAPAEAKLAQWEIMPGYHAELMAIASDAMQDFRLRALAIITLKNGIEKYWRKTATNAIQPAEKDAIRSKFLGFLVEDQPQLITQAATAISRVARFDYPNDWPNLLETLLDAVLHGQLPSSSSASPHVFVNGHAAASREVVSHNALLTLQRTVKELCSKALPASRRRLEQLAPSIFTRISSLYFPTVAAFTHRIPSWLASPTPAGEHHLAQLLGTAVLCAKTQRRLIVQGIQRFHRVKDTSEFFGGVLDHLELIELRPRIPPTSRVHKHLTSLILTIGKLYLDLQKHHLVQFVLCPRAMDVLAFYWGKIETSTAGGPGGGAEQDGMYERFLVQGLMLIKNVVKNPDLSPPQDDQSPDDPTTELSQARSLLATLFTPSFIASLCRVLVSQYLRLSREDLESWEDSPESFVAEEEADHWEFNVRACAEKVFMDVVAQHQETVAPLVIGMLGEVADLGPSVDMPPLLLKDAVYAAVGWCAHRLYDAVDFNGWFRQKLATEVQIQGGAWKLIRRRIAWLTGCWVPIKPSKELDRGLVYSVLVSLLRTDDDLVVRLTAVQNIRLVVDDWDFDPEGFAPFLEGIVDSFVSLLGAVEEFDTKLRILNCLTVIIERMETKILPFAQRVVEVLPSLWAESESQNMFRCAMLVILTKLVTSSREQSMGLQPFVVPLIRHAVDKDEPQHVYLLEDGLDLWLATTQNTSSCDANLMGLIPQALRLLDYDGESSKKALKIFETYAVLDPANFLQQYSFPVCSALATLVGDLKPEAANIITASIDTLLQAAWSASLLPQVLDVMVQTTLLDKVVQVVVLGEEVPWVLVGYLALLARVAIYDVSLFHHLCTLVGQRCNPPQAIIAPLVVSAIVDKMDAVGHPKRRKLFAMTLATVLPTNHESIISQMGAILAVLTEVLVEIREAGNDSLVYWTEPREDFDDEETLDCTRRKAMMTRDPVYTTHLSQFVRTKLAECEAINGGAEAFARNVLGNIDPTIVKLLQDNLR